MNFNSVPTRREPQCFYTTIYSYQQLIFYSYSINNRFEIMIAQFLSLKPDMNFSAKFAETSRHTFNTRAIPYTLQYIR